MNEGSPKKILSYSTNLFKKIETVIQLTGVLWTSNIIRKSLDDETLFIRTGSRELTIILEISELLDGDNMKIEKIPGDKIGDFYPLKGGNRLIFASFDGVISIVEFDRESKTSKVLSTTEVEVSSGEYFRCGAVCPQSKYASFATKKNGYISRLFLYEIKEDFSLALLDVIDYKGTEYAGESSSNMSSICMDFYCGKYPLIAALQELAQNYLFLYKFDGKGLVEYQKDGHLEKYHQDEVMRIRRFEESLYSVDEKGILKRTSFVN